MPHFQNLTGLRFFGAFAVFLFHGFTIGREMWDDFFQGSVFQSIYKVVDKGHYGVNLFFVLSGFLITYLLLHEAKKMGEINPLNFFMRRLLRIWPLYYILVIFGFFIFPHLPFGFQTTHSLMNYSLFLSNFEEIRNGLNDSANFLTVSWSVSIEEQFYMAWVLLIAVIPAFRKGKFFHFYLILLYIISVIFRFGFSENERVLYYHTLSSVNDLAIGGLMAYRVFNYGAPNWLIEMKRLRIVLIYLLGSIFIVVSNQLHNTPLDGFQRIVIALFFAFVIGEQVFAKHSFYHADKLPFFKHLGDISYGFYMYHCVVIYFVQQYFAWQEWTSFTHFLGFLLLSFIGTYLISAMSYKFIEQPILGLKRYFR